MNRKVGSWAVVGALVLILLATLWWVIVAWNGSADVVMNKHGYIAMALGIFFSIIIGSGLMALTFYSSRHGYDDLPQAKEAHSHDNRTK
ncbi:MAG: hypothetical protein J0G28_12390 [Afipia sp.]|nr:hypothetical protein [Afipia sp.]OJW63343.1 MAG: hypothetical protein BGO65_07840 [Afipia sp. 64-13]